MSSAVRESAFEFHAKGADNGQGPQDGVGRCRRSCNDANPDHPDFRKRPDGQVRVERFSTEPSKPLMVWMEMSGALCIELDPDGSSPRSGRCPRLRVKPTANPA